MHPPKRSSDDPTLEEIISSRGVPPDREKMRLDALMAGVDSLDLRHPSGELDMRDAVATVFTSAEDLNPPKADKPLGKFQSWFKRGA